jgi:hypothetical protein
MNTNRENALTAILTRIKKQIVESDTLLLRSPTATERHLITDELTYLRIERLAVEGKLRAANG